MTPCVPLVIVAAAVASGTNGRAAALANIFQAESPLQSGCWFCTLASAAQDHVAPFSELAPRRAWMEIGRPVPQPPAFVEMNRSTRADVTVPLPTAARIAGVSKNNRVRWMLKFCTDSSASAPSFWLGRPCRTKVSPETVSTVLVTRAARAVPRAACALTGALPSLLVGLGAGVSFVPQPDTSSAAELSSACMAGPCPR
jgi:hypothetical protein